MHRYVCNWYVFVTKVSSRDHFLILDTSQPDNPYFREKGYEDPWLFLEAKRGSSTNQVWETVALPISKNYYDSTIKRKFVLMSKWVGTDVPQQSLKETLNQCFVGLISPRTIMTMQSMYAYR